MIIWNKKNNWKTKEALARAAVTLETERSKGQILDVYDDDDDVLIDAVFCNLVT